MYLVLLSLFVIYIGMGVIVTVCNFLVVVLVYYLEITKKHDLCVCVVFFFFSVFFFPSLITGFPQKKKKTVIYISHTCMALLLSSDNISCRSTSSKLSVILPPYCELSSENSDPAVSSDDIDGVSYSERKGVVNNSVWKNIGL